MEVINHAFAVAAEAHASAALGVERSGRAGSRALELSAACTVRVGGPLGVMDIALAKSRKGLRMPDFIKDAARLRAGVKQFAGRLCTHGLSYRSI